MNYVNIAAKRRDKLASANGNFLKKDHFSLAADCCFWLQGKGSQSSLDASFLSATSTPKKRKRKARPEAITSCTTFKIYSSRATTPFSKLWTLVIRSEEVVEHRGLISCASQNVPKEDKHRIYDCRRRCSPAAAGDLLRWHRRAKPQKSLLHTLMLRPKTSFIESSRATPTRGVTKDRHWHLHN